MHIQSLTAKSSPIKAPLNGPSRGNRTTQPSPHTYAEPAISPSTHLKTKIGSKKSLQLSPITNPQGFPDALIFYFFFFNSRISYSNLARI